MATFSKTAERAARAFKVFAAITRDDPRAAQFIASRDGRSYPNVAHCVDLDSDAPPAGADSTPAVVEPDNFRANEPVRKLVISRDEIQALQRSADEPDGAA